MKRVVSILFLSIYLLATTELIQFLKVPALIEHFIEHKENDNSVTFWKFLYMHYANGNVKDADYDKDMKLPFKAHDNCNTSLVLIVPNINHSFIHITYVATFIRKNQLSAYNPTFLGSDYLNTIWQPPKFV